jgi:uncharacterized SAM-binding protein YcdF (DUF218 family)
MFVLSKLAGFVLTPSNLFAGLILLGLCLGWSRRTARLGRALAFTGVALLLVGGFSPLSNWLIAPLEERFPAYRDDTTPIAGVIVLGGAVLPDESAARGQLTLNDAGERLVALSELARRYPDAVLLFSGGSGALLQDEAVEAETVRRFAEALGIAPERLTTEAASRTTAENAARTKELLGSAGGRWLLVTSAWHMPRAVGTFRRVGLDVTAYPVDYRTRGPRDAGRLFNTLSEGLRRLDVAAKEWVGLLAYRLTGRTDELFPHPHPAGHSGAAEGRAQNR